jgi:hypothetical protein
MHRNIGSLSGHDVDPQTCSERQLYYRLQLLIPTDRLLSVVSDPETSGVT